MAGKELGRWGGLSNFQQLLRHVLDCSNHECIIPLCVNTKLMMKHAQVCKKGNCKICQEMKSLALKHSENCVDHECRIPFCIEAKSIRRAAAPLDLSDFLDAIIQDNQTMGPGKQSINTELDGLTNGGFSTISVSSPLDASSNHGALIQMSPALSEIGMGESLRVAANNPSPPISVSCALAASPKQHALTQMPPPLLEIGISECPNAVARESFNQSSSSFKNSSLFSESSRLQQHRQRSICPIPIILASEMANSQRNGALIELYGRPNQGTLTTNNQVATSSMSAEGLENAELLLKDLTGLLCPPITLSAQEKNVPQSQQRNRNTNENHCGEWIHQMNMNCHSSRAEEERDTKSLAVCSNLSSSMGREIEATSGQSILLKVRFMNSLASMMSLIKNTKTRRELLICVNSLRSALQESKRFYNRPKNINRTLTKS